MTRPVFALTILLGVSASITSQASADQTGDALAGQTLAKNLCSACHALDAGKTSPNEAAPNFNVLQLTYPANHLAEGFAEGIVVGTDAHIAMPQFELTTHQIDDLVAYLETVLPPPAFVDEGTQDDGVEF